MTADFLIRFIFGHHALDVPSASGRICCLVSRIIRPLPGGISNKGSLYSAESFGVDRMSGYSRSSVPRNLFPVEFI